MLNGARILLETLKELGVEVIFGYPGGAVLPIYDALYDEKDIKHILTAHEQGATHAADGYARATGKVGVVLVTSGPGATNTVTGIATAYRDSIPMVVVTGQVVQSQLGKAAFQEIDIIGITQPITKKNFIVKDVNELPFILEEAFYVANSGRKGPVLVDIPKDVQVAEGQYVKGLINAKSEIGATFFIDENLGKSIESVAKLLSVSKRPIVYAGGGVISSGASEELVRFSEKIKAPVACTLMGLGSIPGEHENFTGMVGMHGTRCSNYAVTKCDLLIAIGARFSDRVTSNINGFAPDAKVIHIDIDEAELGKNVRLDIPLRGDVKVILEALINSLEERPKSEWNTQIQEWKTKHPLSFNKNQGLSGQYVIEKLHEITKGQCIITTEVGQNQIWASQYYKYAEPRTFISSGGLGTMGFGLGAAIGAYYGNTGRKVINVAGDGSFKMNSTELATISRYRIPIIQLVLNNSCLGMVHQWQEMFYNKRFSHTVFEDEVDFVKLGEAYKIKSIRITREDEVEKVLNYALGLNEPVLIECEISSGEKVFPMVPPGEIISNMIS